MRRETLELKSHTNTPIDGTNPTDNTTTEKTNTLPISVIIQLYNAGFRKLVPLLHDSRRANVYDHLITDEEFKAFASAEGKPVRIIYQNPNFWTEKRLQDNPSLFYNVATTFGLTDLKDSKDSPLYLYGVDVDTKEAFEASKEYGYHFYIFLYIFVLHGITYQELNVDVYKEELWKLVKEILTLQGYDIQKLEDQIYGGEVEDDIVYDTI